MRPPAGRAEWPSICCSHQYGNEKVAYLESHFVFVSMALLNADRRRKQKWLAWPKQAKELDIFMRL